MHARPFPRCHGPRRSVRRFFVNHFWARHIGEADGHRSQNRQRPDEGHQRLLVLGQLVPASGRRPYESCLETGALRRGTHSLRDDPDYVAGKKVTHQQRAEIDAELEQRAADADLLSPNAGE